MTADPKLVEAVARGMCASDGLKWEALLGAMIDHPLIGHYRSQAIAALAAINASGAWWVAPVEATPKMIAEGLEEACVEDPRTIVFTWSAMRTAYLAKETAK